MDFSFTPGPGFFKFLEQRGKDSLAYPLTMETERLILKMRGNPCTASFSYIMVLKETEAEIGFVGIVDDDDLWLQTSETYRNKGYMTEALKAVLSVCYMDMNLTTSRENVAAIKLMQRLGLRFCGENNGIVAYKYIAKENNHGLNR